jgi:hypothetical protein
MPRLETTDFYFAASVIAQGCPLADTQRDGSRCTFCFDFPDEPTRKATILGYYQDSTRVSPLAFARAIKSLKALIHAIR